MNSNIIEEIMEMKENLQQAKEREIAIKAKIDSAMEQIKQEFGFSTLAEAQAELEKMKKQNIKNQEALAESLTEFKKNYGDKLC